MILCDMGKLSWQQYDFLCAREKYVAYGGARGGGKSWAVRTKAKIMAVSYPGIKMLLVRKTYDELIKNHVEYLMPELAGIATYSKTEKVFRFRNGSILRLGYCANEGDLGQYQGVEYDVVFIDEAGQLKQEWVEMINACVRGVNAYPKHVYYTLNPGGPGHAYFKRLFVDRNFEGAEKPENYRFIQALVQDNKALMEMDPEYIQRLEVLPPKLREAWLYGRWDIFEGQFFEDFRPEPDAEIAKREGLTVENLRQQRRWCHVIEPFAIPESWNLYRSYDFGYGKPFSMAWWAVDHDGVIYRIAELYGCTATPNEGVKWAPEEQFTRIAQMEREHPLLSGRSITAGVADPAIWDKSGGESVAETAAKYRVYFVKGNNNRIQGWMQVHNRLQFDAHGYPRMYVFSTCRAFIRTIPALLYSTTHAEDIDTTLEDHVADETRYFCMSRPVAPILHRQEETVLSDPLDQMQKNDRTWRDNYKWTR